MSHVPDVAQIANLLYVYAERLDAGDFGGVAQLFADADILVGEKVTGRGSDHVEQMLRAMVRVHGRSGSPRTRHLITNPIIEVDGDTATSRSCYTVLQPAGGGIAVIATGRHHDTFTCRNGRWRFASRDYSLLDFVGDVSEHLL